MWHSQDEVYQTLTKLTSEKSLKIKVSLKVANSLPSQTGLPLCSFFWYLTLKHSELGCRCTFINSGKQTYVLLLKVINEEIPVIQNGLEST